MKNVLVPNNKVDVEETKDSQTKNWRIVLLSTLKTVSLKIMKSWKMRLNFKIMKMKNIKTMCPTIAKIRKC